MLYGQRLSATQACWASAVRGVREIIDISHPLDLMVRHLATRAVFAVEDVAAILALPHTVRSFDTSAYLIREGDLLGPCLVLVSGFAYRHRLTGEGKRQTVAMHIPGEALNLQQLFLSEADHNVQMLTRGEVAIVPRSALQNLMTNRPSIAQAIAISISAENALSQEWILNIGRRDARSRVAHLLCELAVRLDAQGLAHPDGYLLPMTQEQIGDATGLTAVHVTECCDL